MEESFSSGVNPLLDAGFAAYFPLASWAKIMPGMRAVEYALRLYLIVIKYVIVAFWERCTGNLHCASNLRVAPILRLKNGGGVLAA
jgi:hypothetical protein